MTTIQSAAVASRRELERILERTAKSRASYPRAAYGGTAFFDLAALEREDPSVEMLWGKFSLAIETARKRVEVRGCRQRVRMWSTSLSSLKGQPDCWAYWVIQDR